jgi:hypothetical protein
MTYSPEIFPLAFSMRMSASPQHISSQLGSAFGLHAISDDKIPQKSGGNGALYDNEAVYRPFFKGGKKGDCHIKI